MAISNEPQKIRPDTWYYESEKSIDVYHELRDENGRYVQTINFRLPWRRLKQSLARLEDD